MYKPSHLAVQQRLAHIVSELYFNFLKSEKKKSTCKINIFAICNLFLGDHQANPKILPKGENQTYKLFPI